MKESILRTKATEDFLRLPLLIRLDLLKVL